MNAIERLTYYSQNIPNERQDGENKPPGWPSAGGIKFKDVVLKYREELDPVLKNLNLDIKSGEKIGIVGKTGAGKSSIISALFSLVELSGGSIEIDGIDIKSLLLKDLRTGLSIIPQAPTLFDGTIRSNLDMASRHSDAELWEALSRCGLYDVVKSMDGQLHAKVSEVGYLKFEASKLICIRGLIEGKSKGGENLSVGQRQLLCLGTFR